MPNLPYASADAFRRALLDRLRAAAGPEADPQQLLKEFAFDRLLARAFTAEPDAWVLKGAAGLSSQLPVARHTRDIDLWLREPVPPAELEARLQTAAGIDLDDFTEIDVRERGRIVGFADVAGWRFTATLRVGDRPLHRFGVDAVVGAGAFGEPERVPPLIPVAIPGLPQADYVVAGMPSQVADKLQGVLRPTVHGRPSTRHHDLIDLALIARQRPLDGAELRAAVVAKFAGRGIPPPERFEVPDVARFARGYRRDAPAALQAELDFDQAASLVKRLADPVLAGTAVGRWSPERGRWMELAPPELRRPEPRPEVALHERWTPPRLEVDGHELGL
jgi:hypothetical protein